MPRMNKGNAREMLSQTIRLFQEITKESIGVVYSYKGGLSVLGSNSFRKYVSDNRENILLSLSCTGQKEDILKMPERDSEMINKLNDLKNLNVQTLRSIVSWATQKSIGMCTRFNLVEF